MSGAAANSAARRRRVGAQSVSDTLVSNTLKREPVKPIHPLELLTLHDRRLFILENTVKNITRSSLPDIKETDIILNADSETNLTNQLYESRIQSLEDDLAQLKKLVTVLQTFSMETNLALTNLKSQTKVE